MLNEVRTSLRRTEQLRQILGGTDSLSEVLIIIVLVEAHLAGAHVTLKELRTYSTSCKNTFNSSMQRLTMRGVIRLQSNPSDLRTLRVVITEKFLDQVAERVWKPSSILIKAVGNWITLVAANLLLVFADSSANVLPSIFGT